MIRIIHAYPDLLNLYGEYADILLLKKRLEADGEEVVVDIFEAGDDIDFTDADLVYFGCGTENKMLAAARDISRLHDKIAEYYENDGKLIFCGASIALPLCEIVDLKGDTTKGLGLLQGSATISDKRKYSEVVAECDGVESYVIGTFNSSLAIDCNATPYLSVKSDLEGFVGQSEGIKSKGLIATQLSGPLLFRNPNLLDFLAESLAGHELAECNDKWYRELCLAYNHALKVMQGEK